MATTSEPLRPSAILESSLYTPDLDAGRIFYEDLLGLELYSEEAGRHLFFRCGGGMLLLFNPAQAEISTGAVPTHGGRGPGHLAFSIQETEVEDWRSHLTNSGIAIEAEISWPAGGRSLYFRDPAGNSLELATPKTWGLPQDE